MRIEGDGRQYWLVLNPNPDQERIERVLELLKKKWSIHPTSLMYFLHFIADCDNKTEDDELIRVLEENL